MAFCLSVVISLDANGFACFLVVVYLSTTIGVVDLGAKSLDQRTDMKQATQQYEKNANLLMETEITLQDTVQVGESILDELDSQGQTIQGMRERMRDIGGILDRACTWVGWTNADAVRPSVPAPSLSSAASRAPESVRARVDGRRPAGPSNSVAHSSSSSSSRGRVVKR